MLIAARSSLLKSAEELWDNAGNRVAFAALAPSSNPPALLAVPPWLLDHVECMSALQKDEEDVQAVSSVPHAQYPWQLKCCSQNGETKLYHMPEQDSTSLYFAGAATAATHLLYISPCQQPPTSLADVCCLQSMLQLAGSANKMRAGGLCCSGLGACERGAG